MAETARLFENGRSQAVRLPKEYRFAGSRVYIKRLGKAVVLLPYHEPWQTLVDSLDQFSDDFIAAREQPGQQDRGEMFE